MTEILKEAVYACCGKTTADSVVKSTTGKTSFWWKAGSLLEFFVEFAKSKGGNSSNEQTKCIEDKSLKRLGKAFKRNNHNCGPDYNADDPMKGYGIVSAKQGIDCFGKQDNSGKAAYPSGQQYGKVHMTDTRHKGLIQTQRHEQGGKAHSRHNYT